jgi:hydrogenase-4 component B
VWLVVGLVALVLERTSRAAADTTWGCGYTQPTARMQYTGAAFAEYIVTRLLPVWMAPVRSIPARPTGAFAGPARASSSYDDPLTRSVYQPSLERWEARMTRLHWIQQGILHVYFLYIFVVVVIAFAWLALRAWMGS